MTDETRQSPTKTVSQLAWSCEQRDRKHCRDPHGCHCREITDLMFARDKIIADLNRVTRNRDMWKGQCERQAQQLSNRERLQ